MPAFTPWAGFSTNEANADELSEALFSSASVDDSFDILNGGLDQDNWTGSTIPYWAVQPGTWATGYYYGFDRRDFVYTKQTSNAYDPPASTSAYGLVGSLTHSLFVPFDAELVLFGFQAFCAQYCDNNGMSGDGETFYMLPHVNGVAFTELITMLPHTSDTADTASPTDRFESRFRQSGATGLLKATAFDDTKAVDKGRLTFDLFVYGDVAESVFDPRVEFVTGGFWALAIR